MTIYRAAAIQYEPVQGEKEQNILSLLRLTEDAAQHDARLIVLPEMATTGHCWESREEIAPYVEPIPGATTEHFRYLATKYDCFIAFGLPEVDPITNVYYNSMALVGPESLVGVYRKVHSSISEPRWARDGDLDVPLWETPLGRLSCLIGDDATYFESGRIATVRGADVLLFPTNWSDEKCPSSYWMARAWENGVYFIAANRYGSERGLQFRGGSCILDPDGTVQAYLDDGSGIVYGEIDLDRSRDKHWGRTPEKPVGDRLADRHPTEYVSLVNNTYLWEPLRYHGLYELGELPPGQLSCVGVIQTDLLEIQFQSSEASGTRPQSSLETVQVWHRTIETLLNEHAPTRPDLLVLPELILPGPIPLQDEESLSREAWQKEIMAHFHQGAIAIPGPEIDVLVNLADTFQMNMVLGVAEREQTSTSTTYYNTVLLIDPEGVYGKYRKIHLTHEDRLWASPGNLGMPTFDTPTGRVALATGYDVLFPEVLRVLAGKGVDLVAAPAFLAFPDPIGLAPSAIITDQHLTTEEYDPIHFLLWRVRAAEHNVYLALANWSDEHHQNNALRANGNSGIFSPSCSTYPWSEVIADAGELALTMMTIDTREQRTGRRRSSSLPLEYAPGDVVGSLTGELAYDIRDTIPGNVVRSKPCLRKRQPLWYLDLVRTAL